MNAIDTLFEKALEDRVFPCASLLVFSKDDIIFKKNYGTLTYEDNESVRDEHLFDIASLTKPLVTSLLICNLIEEGEIEAEKEMSYFFSEFKSIEKQNITIRDMLNHRSGLPAHREYFKGISKEIWGSPAAKEQIINAALNEEVTGYSRTLYSDIDFIILGYLIEKITTVNLREYLKDSIFNKIGILKSDFCGNVQFGKEDLMVPVAKGYKGVDDENCRAMGGIAGHAGLFSNTYEIYLLLKEIYNSYTDSDWRVLRPDIFKDLIKKSNDFLPSMFRGGFDTPLIKGSQYGDHFSDNTIGHLGFTGTSFVIDLNTGSGIILFTNRVYPDRGNNKIREFRSIIHNQIINLFKREMGL